jgi:hypothetical protein
MELCVRCQRYTSSIVTPMGDEMFYRYQESLIDVLTTKLAAIPSLALAGEKGGRTSDGEESRLSDGQADRMTPRSVDDDRSTPMTGLQHAARTSERPQ